MPKQNLAPQQLTGTGVRTEEVEERLAAYSLNDDRELARAATLEHLEELVGHQYPGIDWYPVPIISSEDVHMAQQHRPDPQSSAVGPRSISHSDEQKHVEDFINEDFRRE